jgi:DegV family protein with EDD domain
MGEKLKVFILVDDPIMGNLLEVRLEETGYDARYIEDAEAAQAAAAAEPSARAVIVAEPGRPVSAEEKSIPLIPLPKPFTWETLQERLAEVAPERAPAPEPPAEQAPASETGEPLPTAAPPEEKRETEPADQPAETGPTPVAAPGIGGLLASFRDRRATGLLEVRDLPEKAAVHLEDGEIVDAHYGEATGRKALYRILRASDGAPQFHSQPRLATEARSIREDFQVLMAEAAREAETLRRLKPGVFDSALSVDEEGLAESPEVREHRGLSHILSLVGQHGRMGRVMDGSRLTDFQTYTNLLYLLKKGVVRARRGERIGLRIITDSTADLPQEMIEAYDNLTVVPITVRLDGQTYRDGFDISPRRFYERLKQSKSVPETFPPTPEEFYPVFEGIVGDADILGIFLSRALSDTAANARIAVDRYSDAYRIRRRSRDSGGSIPRISVLDSRAVSLGMGLLVAMAADKAAAGASLDEVRDQVAAAMPSLRIFFAVDALGHLRRGGRLGKGRTMVGRMLGIRPILGVRKGELVHVDQAMGEAKVPELLAEWVHWSLPDPAIPLQVGIMHAQAPERADRLKAALMSRFDCRRVTVSQIGPAVGAHCGPGAVGVAVLSA